MLNIEIPKRLETGAWHGHITFAQWIIRVLKPEIFVELGTHKGDSYFAFCQSVEHNKLNTKCFAVDSWQGEKHAGEYGSEVFDDVNNYNNKNYSDFSTLYKCSFDEAIHNFQDGSIELLHIDGLHTYEAVKHDFEMWKPKLSKDAIILFHDTTEIQTDFGVWRFWEEIEKEYSDKTFLFLHSHGLGVLGLGKKLPPELRSLFESNTNPQMIRSFLKNKSLFN